MLASWTTAAATTTTGNITIAAHKMLRIRIQSAGMTTSADLLCMRFNADTTTVYDYFTNSQTTGASYIALTSGATTIHLNPFSYDMHVSNEATLIKSVIYQGFQQGNTAATEPYGSAFEQNAADWNNTSVQITQISMFPSVATHTFKALTSIAIEGYDP